MRLVALLFGLLFAVAAVVQFNDPDWWYWVPAYVLAAAVCLANAFVRLPRIVTVGFACVALGAAIATVEAFVQTGADWNPEGQFLAEEVREAGGYLIIAAGCGLPPFIPRRRSASKKG